MSIIRASCRPRSPLQLWTLALAALLLAACNPLNVVQPAQPTASPAAPPAASPDTAASPALTSAPSSNAPADTPPASIDQPVAINGEFAYTNDILTTYYVEHAVALVDMYGFVTRDREWEIPVEGQTLGFMAIDEDARQGEFRLQLPARPQGTAVSLGSTDGGSVQVFAVAY